jgi:hypothetical protein
MTSKNLTVRAAVSGIRPLDSEHYAPEASLFMVVRKSEYWEVTTTEDTASIAGKVHVFWVPFAAL